MVNFINDQKYHLLRDQLYFTMTEFITYLVLMLYLPKQSLHKEAKLETSYYLFTMSLFHAIQSLYDQAFRNIFYFFKFSIFYFLGIRDVMLLSVDLFVLILSIRRIRWLYLQHPLSTKRNVFLCVGIALAHFIVFSLFLST